MKLFSIVLLIGLVVTASEGKRYIASRALASRTASDTNGMATLLSSLLMKGPASIAKKFGIDLPVLNDNIEYWIKVLEPQLKSAVLQVKIMKAAEILTKLPKVLGVDLNVDFTKLANDFEARITSGAQLLLSLAKMAAAALKTFES